MAGESPDSVRPQGSVALVGGRYRLDGVLGCGGFGVVHRATDELLQRVVAVKEVRLPISGSADERDRARERVLREARAAGRLQHPGAVSVLDVIDDGDLPWIIMEYVEGRALSRIITGEGPRPVDETCRVGISLAYALEAAHRLGIVHRDVKPSNVLITPDGRARLTDFGIAVSHGDPRLTSTGMVLGSPAYLPPERARGDAGSASGDRWALGATLFTTVEGSPPFGGGDPIAVLGALMRGQRQPFRLAGPLAPLLDDLMAPQATSRPPLSLVRRRLREILDLTGDHRSSRSGARTTRGLRSDRSARVPAVVAPPPPASAEVAPFPAGPIAPATSLAPTVAVHAPEQTAATPTARAGDTATDDRETPTLSEGAGVDSPSPPLADPVGKPPVSPEAATPDVLMESLATNDVNTAHTPPMPAEIPTKHNTDDERLPVEQHGESESPDRSDHAEHGPPAATPPESVEVTAAAKEPAEPAGPSGAEDSEPTGTASTIAAIALVEAAVIGATATLATAATAALHVVGAGTPSTAKTAEQAVKTFAPRGPADPGSPSPEAATAHADEATRSTPAGPVEAEAAAAASDPDDSDPDDSDPGPSPAPHAEAPGADAARALADQPDTDPPLTDGATPAGQAARPRPTGPLERIRHADRMRALGGIPARARLVRRGTGGSPPVGPAASTGTDQPPGSGQPTGTDRTADGPRPDSGLPQRARPARKVSAPTAGAVQTDAATPASGLTADPPALGIAVTAPAADGLPPLPTRSRLGQHWPRARPAITASASTSPPPLAFRAASPPGVSTPDTFPAQVAESSPWLPAGTAPPPTSPPPAAGSLTAGPPTVAEPGATAPGDKPRRRWRRIAVASVAGALVTAAAIILLVVLSRPGSVDAASAGRVAAPTSGPNAEPRGGRTAGAQPVDPAVVPAVPVAHDTVPAPAPPGWASYTDPDAGWSVAYPTGWRRQAGPGGPGNVDFMDPVSGSFLRVGSVRQANTSAIVDWQRNEAGFVRSVQDYRRVRLASSDGGDGTNQADWEFTYRRSDGVMVHVLNRGAIRNGHGYALYWHTRDDLWLQDQPLLRQLLGTFRPGP
ncbi:serine/threonine-protein kinase [Frankia sp. AgB32]|uniref:serine/threonine-protein kinase n=1 Tax=Frankia sp. AgB32 TaxID=631119 RepID=UPI00200C6EFA|nr:serine/threonine-protein kinase [Frankia sp. AgB32]MCK9896876.1 protein kinase [Frankia sp. AgB32]